MKVVIKDKVISYEFPSFIVAEIGGNFLTFEDGKNYIDKACEFGINKKYHLASELKPEGASTELLLDICKKVGADCYLSGTNGKDYLNEDLFKNHNIEVEYQNFNHPVYPKLYGDFVAGLSSIDLLFNCGKDSLLIIEEFNK